MSPRFDGRDEAKHGAFREWNRLRVANICARVSAADVLSRNGVTLRKSGLQAEQISCPFHGKDERPSAKYFPEEGGSRSHVWCFVCHESWDAIGLWKKFSGTENFSELLRELERAFGLTAPEAPTPAATLEHQAQTDPLAGDARQLFELCERKLREYRGAFEMTSHLKLGALIDQTRFYLGHGHINSATAIERLKLIIARINEILEKARASSASDS